MSKTKLKIEDQEGQGEWRGPTNLLDRRVRAPPSQPHVPPISHECEDSPITRFTTPRE